MPQPLQVLIPGADAPLGLNRHALDALRSVAVGRLDDALDAASNILPFIQAPGDKAHLYELSGRLEEAIAAVEHLIALAPDDDGMAEALDGVGVLPRVGHVDCGVTFDFTDAGRDQRAAHLARVAPHGGQS